MLRLMSEQTKNTAEDSTSGPSSFKVKQLLQAIGLPDGEDQSEGLDTVRAFVEVQMLPDGGYPKKYHVRDSYDLYVNGEWRHYEERTYWDTGQNCLYYATFSGGWVRVRCI